MTKCEQFSTTKNTVKYLKTYSADLPNPPKYLGYLKKNFQWVYVVCDVAHEKKEISYVSRETWNFLPIAYKRLSHLKG